MLASTRFQSRCTPGKCDVPWVLASFFACVKALLKSCLTNVNEIPKKIRPQEIPGGRDILSKTI
jgi:hypothetical protein